MKKRLPILILLVAAAVGIYLWQSGAFAKPDNRIVVSGNLELTRFLVERGANLETKTPGQQILGNGDQPPVS